MRGALALSPYELVLSEIEKGRVDPFDVDLQYLIGLFKEEAEKLKEWEYLEEAGRFLQACTKLLKLQVEKIFPAPKPERKRITIKEVRDVLVDTENNYESEYDLSWLWEHEVRVGRPSGAKDRVERKLSRKEFLEIAQKDLKEVLHEEVDYHKLARKVRDKILRGEPIKTLREFIAYLHAYMEFDDVPELSDHHS